MNCLRLIVGVSLEAVLLYGVGAVLLRRKAVNIIVVCNKLHVCKQERHVLFTWAVMILFKSILYRKLSLWRKCEF